MGIKLQCILLLLSALTAITLGCSHALGEWEKKSPEEKAGLSPIVVVGYVTESYKHLATKETRYAVDFKIIRTIKGSDLINALPADNITNSNIHRITNFGSIQLCFADVSKRYVLMLFLEVVDDHLAAHYSDLFGAAEIWTMDMEDKVILSNLGYKTWTEWSSCSESCNAGIQQRVRQCTKANGACMGHNVQKRACNTFSCNDAQDLVKLGKFDEMAKGVISLNISGQSIYDITPNFYGQIPAANVFSPLWPQQLSVLGRIRPRKTKYPREGQYLFSLADSDGRQYLGLKAYPSPTLELLHNTGQTTSVSISLPHENINDGEWHQFGFSVHGRNISMFYNCMETTQQIIPMSLFVPSVYRASLILGTRMFSMDRGAHERYEGALSQLVITDNLRDASRQCSSQTWEETDKDLKSSNSPRQFAAQASSTPEENYLEHWEWSTWSGCSSSCGFGIKIRKPFCLDESINSADCIPYYVPRVHKRRCHASSCPKCDCANGGKCAGICECPTGWTGPKCEKAVCEAGCGFGQCIKPDKCSCLTGWTGRKCDKTVCFPLCQNEGTCLANNQCKCKPGFSGRFCTEKTSTISCTKKCRNGGECVGINKCSCPPGWRGSRCHKPAHVCTPACANGGICRKNNRCKCTRGFTGPTCKLDVCNGNCRNGGLCDRKSRTCICPLHFAGKLCQYEVKEELCKNNPCQNVGQCVGLNRCVCPDGWFGLRCEYRKCSKYKVTVDYKIKEVKKIKYINKPCTDSSGELCRVADGFTYETKPVMISSPNYTQCENG